jgi:hypothetical protein
MFSEGNVARLVGSDIPLQIEMAVWHIFLKFEIAGLDVVPCC